MSLGSFSSRTKAAAAAAGGGGGGCITTSSATSLPSSSVSFYNLLFYTVLLLLVFFITTTSNNRFQYDTAIQKQQERHEQESQSHLELDCLKQQQQQIIVSTSATGTSTSASSSTGTTDGVSTAGTSSNSNAGSESATASIDSSVTTEKRATKTKERRSSKAKYSLSETCASDYTKFDQIYSEGHWGARIANSPEAFYNNAKWPPKERSSASGAGSNLGIATETSLDVVRMVINKYNISTMIDIPSGDVNWIFDSWETDSLQLYIGLDIVRAVVELNTKRFQFHSNKIFQLWDGALCPLPQYYSNDDDTDTDTETDTDAETDIITTNRSRKHSVELVHSRDVLQHLPQQSSIQFLCNVFQSGAKYFITTLYTIEKANATSNIEINGGDWFMNNLDLPPFSIPRDTEDTYCVETHPTIEPDQTCVYDLTKPWVQPWVQEKCGLQ